MTDHYEMPHPDADACAHAGVGKACRPCREVLDNLHRIDLRNTPAGKQLMAEALEEEAYVMAVVISNGDAAEVTAPTPGESGRWSAVAARDALYEDPAEYLRNRVSTYRREGDA